MEFLRILEEYRLKCEEGGDYLEAGRAQRQLDVLRRQETRRQQNAVRARQLSERQDVQVIQRRRALFAIHATHRFSRVASPDPLFFASFDLTGLSGLPTNACRIRRQD